MDKNKHDDGESGINLLQRIFNLIGWLGFLLLLPPGLQLAGLPALQDFLVQNLGPLGSASWLMLYFFGIQLLRVFFGSSRLLTPLITGFLSTFLLASLVMPVGFMEWLYRLLEPTKLFARHPLTFLLVPLVLGLGYLLSFARRLPVVVQLLLLVLLPFAGAVALNLLGVHDWFATLTGLKPN